MPLAKNPCLTCKNYYFMSYSLYKRSPHAIIEMNSLTCVPSQLCETWNVFWQNFCLVYIMKAMKSQQWGMLLWFDVFLER